MSEDQRQFDELTPFEAALAGLVPRVEGFDRERLIFLAGRAAALRDCGAGVSPACRIAGGTPAPRLRWAWPAAFSAMTAVAAALLVMLCTRPAATVATSGQKDSASSIAIKFPAALVNESQPSSELSAPTGSREGDFADATFPESDPVLRAEFRRHGIDFSRPRAAASDSPMVIAEGPTTYFELLSRLQGKGPAGQGGLKEMMQ